MGVPPCVETLWEGDDFSLHVLLDDLLGRAAGAGEIHGLFH